MIFLREFVTQITFSNFEGSQEKAKQKQGKYNKKKYFYNTPLNDFWDVLNSVLKPFLKYLVTPTTTKEQANKIWLKSRHNGFGSLIKNSVNIAFPFKILT